MNSELKEEQGVRIAIEGCGHGTLHAIYASTAEACRQKGWPGVDLLIIGGDFQAVRNAYDLNCVSMPAKYREMCDFHEYYSGQRVAPYLTIFVGGNHEASNYLFELYYGGWVAPNIYYMGAANVLRLGPLRIAGMSGIWKGYNYRKPHYERLPYNESDMKSIYHTREPDVRKLLQIQTQVDIGISHDWPRGVEWKGNWKQLFRFKPHFEEDAKNGQLGSLAAQKVMDLLRPSYWFSAHLHAKFAALVHYQDDSHRHPPQNGTKAVVVANEDEIDLDEDEQPSEVSSAPVPKNEDEIDLDMDEEVNGIDAKADANESIEAQRETIPSMLSAEEARAALPASFRRPEPPAREHIEHPPAIANKTTHFLALDKCLPNRNFLQLISIPANDDVAQARPFRLSYDREWLAITRSFALQEPLALGDPDSDVPHEKRQSEYRAHIATEQDFVKHKFTDIQLTIPENFEIIAPPYDGGNWNLPQYSQALEYPNPQTAKFCEMLEIPNAFAMSDEVCKERLNAGPRPDPRGDRPSHNRGGRGGFEQGGGRGRGRGRGRGSHGHGRGHFRGRWT